MSNNLTAGRTEIFPWNSWFEVGVEEIDSQHRELVKLINEICSCALSSKNFEETINSLFTQLIEYSKYHFESEEHHFETNSLPGQLLKVHEQQHSQLIADVVRLKAKYDEDTNKNANLEEILTTLVMWLTNHILGDDMRMCMVITNLSSGMDVQQAKDRADEDMQGAKGTIARVMGSMMHISSASVLELRREIAYRMELEEKLKHIALHDALTGLPNRRMFEELADAALRGAKRNSTEQAILFVDIDGFKAINDTLGHKAGDELLIVIAKRLQDCLRESDVVARIGGDEFVVYLGGDCTQGDAKSVAEKMVAAISEPFQLDEGSASVGASIGISVYPDDAEEAETLVKNADAAMYAAKKSGKNTYRLFNSL